jgi:hypothetical protein
MGSNPSVAIRFRSDKAPSDIISSIEKIVEKDSRFELDNKHADDKGGTVDVTFTSPGCGWLDRVTIKVTAENNESIIMVG